MTAETDLLDFAPCRCGTEDPMAIFVSRAGEPMQMRGELYVVCCRWCGENAPFAFVGIGAEELNQASIAAWNRRACVSSATEALRAEVAEWKRVASAQAELHGESEARAERLAEALQRLVNSFPEEGVLLDAGWDGCEVDEACEAYDAARAVLEQENGHE